MEMSYLEPGSGSDASSCSTSQNVLSVAHGVVCELLAPYEPAECMHSERMEAETALCIRK